MNVSRVLKEVNRPRQRPFATQAVRAMIKVATGFKPSGVATSSNAADMRPRSHASAPRPGAGRCGLGDAGPLPTCKRRKPVTMGHQA